MKGFIKYGLLTLISIFIIGLVLLTVFESENGVLIIVVDIFVFCCLYFPTILLDKIKSNNKESVKWLNYAGLTGISFGVLALIFRMFHWPGGSALGVIGTFIFTVNYLPFWFYYQWKNKSKIDKYFYLIFCSALGLMLVHYLFKSQHWPWANKLGYSSSFSLFYF
ncbi:MAG: hypothetical protein V4667_07830 [Bacteroidota bacterium]